MVVQEHVRKGGIVTVDTDGVVTLKSNVKEHSKESSRVAAMVEARRSDGQGIQMPPKRTESAKARRDRARNTHANYIARQEKRREERLRQAQAAATTAAALSTTTQTKEADVVVVDITGESMKEEGTTIAPERHAVDAEPGKRRVVETQPNTAVAARRGSAQVMEPMTTSKASKAINKKTTNDTITATRGEKRGIEAHEATQRARMRSLPRDFSQEGKKIAVSRAASAAASTTGKGITRKTSKGEITGYAKTVYKALTRGERMLAAAQE